MFLDVEVGQRTYRVLRGKQTGAGVPQGGQVRWVRDQMLIASAYCEAT